MDAIRADDCITTYSSRTPSRLDLVLTPGLTAPGNKIISLTSDNSALTTMGAARTMFQQYSAVLVPVGQGFDNSVEYLFSTVGNLDGAAGRGGGAAALLLQANTVLTPDTIKARLMLSADSLLRPAEPGTRWPTGGGT